MRPSHLVAVVVVLVGGALLLYRTPITDTRSSAPTEQKGEFAGVSLNLEFATTTKTREKGLGGRNSIPDDYGMLFSFPDEGMYGFWMKDTLIPLDIFWLDTKGRVVYVAADVDPSSYPYVFYPPVPAQYVLETRAGFARIHQIRTGIPLRLQNWPTVSE